MERNKMNDHWNDPPESKEDEIIEEVMFLLEESGVERELLDKYETYLYELVGKSNQECPVCAENREASLSVWSVIMNSPENKKDAGVE